MFAKFVVHHFEFCQPTLILSVQRRDYRTYGKTTGLSGPLIRASLDIGDNCSRLELEEWSVYQSENTHSC